MAERSLSDPASMVGASRDEVLALLPPGWIVRPFPPGRAGFQMVSPGKMPGAFGTIGFFKGGRPGFRRFTERPEPRLFVLNVALEQPLLVALLIEWTGSPARPGEVVLDDLLRMSDAAQQLAREGRIAVYEDVLVGDELRLLATTEAVTALGEPANWWRDEYDTSVAAARSVFVVDLTTTGAAELAAIDQPRRRWRRR